MKIKVLVISSETWRSDVGGGNVLNNFFGPLKDYMVFANIYCGNDMPQNDVCSSYYQISENALIQDLLLFRRTGRRLNGNECYDNNISSRHTINYGRKHYPVEYLIRNLIWKIARWKNSELKKFILDFNPDIIYAPLYGQNYMYMLDIEEYASAITGKKIFSYISDDLLSLKQISYSPVFWISRLYYRWRIKKFSSKVQIMYTMTDEQKIETEEYLKIPVKILRKSADFTGDVPSKQITAPIKFIYAGNMFYGRYKTIYTLAEQIKHFNDSYGKRFELHIFSRDTFDKSIMNVINDGNSSFMHGLISPEELNAKYSESDIALHVEDFEKTSQYLTRLSFSTKIIDLLQSGCAVMAIGPSNIASISYLQKEDAAICVTDLTDLQNQLRAISSNTSVIELFRRKAWLCGKRNHDVSKNNEMFLRDFSNC